MTANSDLKKKFRATKKWKTFRESFNKEKDFITLKKLYKGWQLHHLDLDPDNYYNLIVENFIPLNVQTHEFIHWLYNYYRTDKAVINRIQNALERMYNLNEGE